MKKPTFTFNDIPDALESLFSQQQEILNLLESKQSNRQDEKEILSCKEACELFGISKTTLWRWEKSGKAKTYGIDRKRFYKRSELIELLTPINQ